MPGHTLNSMWGRQIADRLFVGFHMWFGSIDSAQSFGIAALCCRRIDDANYRRTITSSGCECARPCALQRRDRLVLLYARPFARLPSTIQPHAFVPQSAPAAPVRIWKLRHALLAGEPNGRRLPASLTVWF